MHFGIEKQEFHVIKQTLNLLTKYYLLKYSVLFSFQTQNLFYHDEKRFNFSIS